MEKLLCNENNTLFQVMQIINENAKGIAFIVDDGNTLKGIVTDGDIRRVLLKGGELHLIVNEVMNKEYIYALDDESTDSMLNKMNEKIKLIPVVDRSHQVVSYFEYRTDLTVPVTTPTFQGNELKYLTEALLSSWISSSGKYIPLFEEMFSSYSDCRHGVAVSNGTVALHLALVALGIGPGDEVIVPDLTFAATINIVLHAGATPVIVDVEEDSWCIDPQEIEKAITERTKAIIPVHLYGQPCDMGRIMEIARAHNLYVIEDCAEAHGATFNGSKVGSFGDVGCFSFFANKIITTGEGGMCVTNSDALAMKMKLLRDHGMSKGNKYWHEVVGYNYRMTNMQAAIGVAQTEKITSLLSLRGNIEQKYKDILSIYPFIRFQEVHLNDRKKVTWLVSILVEQGNRDEVMNLLKQRSVDSRPFFYSLSDMPLYSKYTFSNKNSTNISAKGINLPTLINMSDESFNAISQVFNEYGEILNNGVEEG